MSKIGEPGWGRWKPTFGSKQDQTNPLSQGLVGHWLFNENAGLKAFDVAGKNDGTLVGGVSLGASKFGKTLNFDGANDYVTMGNVIDDVFAGANKQFSISLWVKPDATMTNAIVIGKYRTSDAQREFFMRVFTGSKIEFLWYGVLTGGTFRGTSGSTAITDTSKWYHVVATYDGTNATINSRVNLYVDGVAESTSITSSSGTPSSIPAGIASLELNNSVSSAFTGSLDDVRVYNRILSPGEIQQLYLSPFNDIISPPKSRYRIYTYTAVVTSIALDATSNSGYQASASPYSWSHTCTGSNRFLTVDVSIFDMGITVSGITYNGVALTSIGVSDTGIAGIRVESWRLIAPATGSNTITVTLSASARSSSTAVSYTGVHQTTPTEGFNSNSATNVGATDATVSVTSVADQDWIHAAISSDDATITAGQTTRNNVSGAGGSGANEDFGPQSAGAKTMSYTAVGAAATWAITGYAIQPVQTVFTAYPKFFLMFS